MISQMMVPLMQLLIDAVFLENPAQVKLYALPVIPHMVQGHPSVKIKLLPQCEGKAASYPLLGRISCSNFSGLFGKIQKLWIEYAVFIWKLALFIHLL
jgi:hypothetical protein